MILLQNQFSVTFFSVNESSFETEFNLNHDLITEAILRDFFSIWVNIIFFLGIKSIMTSYVNPWALSYPLQYAVCRNITYVFTLCKR